MHSTAIIAFLMLIPGFFASSLTATAQIAEDDRKIALNDAFEQLQSAPTAIMADKAEAEIWGLWFIGPNRIATTKLGEAAQAIRRSDLDQAHQMLDGLIAEQPDFAEAWNQRAFAKFLKGDHFGSLIDIRETLKREPRHFGALAGRAQIEAGMGKLKAATRTMGEVGKVHPWMARGSAIPPDPVPPVLGEEL